MVICGDFNYPKISWDASDTSRGANEQAFVEALHDHYLTQIQRKPTRGTSVLDLVITSVPDQTSVSDVLEIDKPGLFTDHRTVFFEFRTLVKAPVKTHRSVYDFPKGDFDGLTNACVQLILLVWWVRVTLKAAGRFGKTCFLLR